MTEEKKIKRCRITDQVSLHCYQSYNKPLEELKMMRLKVAKNEPFFSGETAN